MAKKQTSEIKQKKQKKSLTMVNITFSLPDIYVEKIQWLIDHELIKNRSEAIRNAIREFLKEEYKENLKILGYS